MGPAGFGWVHLTPLYYADVWAQHIHNYFHRCHWLGLEFFWWMLPLLLYGPSRLEIIYTDAISWAQKFFSGCPWCLISSITGMESDEVCSWCFFGLTVWLRITCSPFVRLLIHNNVADWCVKNATQRALEWQSTKGTAVEGMRLVLGAKEQGY